MTLSLSRHSFVWLLAGVSIGMAGSVLAAPDVWMIAPDFGADFVSAFAKKIPNARIETSIGDAERVLAWLRDKETPARSDVLFLNCGPSANTAIAQYAEDLRAIVAAAHERQLEVLWFDSPPEVPDADLNNATAAKTMDSLGVTTVAFHDFSRGLGAKDAPGEKKISPKAFRKQGEFLAESLMQWWAACATTNPQARHVKLWSGQPPAYDSTGPERVNPSARIDHVTEPEIVRFLPKARTLAPAVIFFPGGGYSYLGFLRNAKDLADRLDSHGIAVIGLKYRTGRPREVALLDAQRAVRFVRYHAKEWGLDPTRIGIAGQSAGANLVLNLASHFDRGLPSAEDLVERESSRPDFLVVLTSWHFGEKRSPFTFQSGELPPVFLRHAKDDSSFALAQEIVSQLKERGASIDYQFIEKGGHGAFELSPENPGSRWPEDLVTWLRRSGILTAADSSR